MENHEKDDINTFVWRLVSVIICLLLLGSFFFRYLVLSTYEYSPIIVFGMSGLLIPGITLIALMILLVIFPYHFYIHAVFCWGLGLLFLLDGGSTNALFMHLVSYIFLYRQGFFKKKALVKLICGGVLLLFVILTQLHFDLERFASNLPVYMNVALSPVIAGILLKPEIDWIKKRGRRMTLRLSPPRFTKKDALILEKIIQGEKYEAIAAEIQMPIGTLKRKIRNLFMKLQVSDRTLFLTLYAKHKVVFEDTGETTTQE